MDRFFTPAWNLQIIGTYAQTEMGHGKRTSLTQRLWVREVLMTLHLSVALDPFWCQCDVCLIVVFCVTDERVTVGTAAQLQLLPL